MFRNVLIADSGKGHVEDMVQMLQNLPAFQKAKLNLLHVVDEQTSGDVSAHQDQADLLLTSAMDKIGLKPEDVNKIIRQGDPKQTVLAVADELDADLIIMGSRGLGRLRSILANSTSQYVFQLSTRPMLLVRDDIYIRHINRVLVAVDGTGVGNDAIKIACELTSQIPGGQLTGIHLSRQDLVATRGGQTKADEVLRTAVARARSFGVAMAPLHRTGVDIGKGVCAAAEEIRADLVVIASQDRRPLIARQLVDLDKLLGSSASDYIRVHAQAPVLLVRESEQRVSSVG